MTFIPFQFDPDRSEGAMLEELHKDLDWMYSSKDFRLISEEEIEFRGRPAACCRFLFERADRTWETAPRTTGRLRALANVLNTALSDLLCLFIHQRALRTPCLSGTRRAVAGGQSGSSHRPCLPNAAGRCNAPGA